MVCISINTSHSRSNRGIRRLELLSKISKYMRDKIYESALDCDSVYENFWVQSGWIDITASKQGDVEVVVIHRNGHESPMLEKAIEKILPDWREIQAEREREIKEEDELRDYLQRSSSYW